MAHTNNTDNYALPQWLGTDKPSWLGDMNQAFEDIDTNLHEVSVTAEDADTKADTASALAQSAQVSAQNAKATAEAASTTAATASQSATTAQQTATAAQTAAANAQSAANSANSTASAAQETATAAANATELLKNSLKFPASQICTNINSALTSSDLNKFRYQYNAALDAVVLHGAMYTSSSSTVPDGSVLFTIPGLNLTTDVLARNAGVKEGGAEDGKGLHVKIKTNGNVEIEDGSLPVSTVARLGWVMIPLSDGR